MRVVLCTGGEGTAEVARATAVLAARRGQRTALLAAATVTELDVQVLEPRPMHWLDSVWPAIAESILRAGECPLLPGVAELELWSRLQHCLQEPGLDAVVVDCGSIDRTITTLSLIESLPWVMERAVPPQDQVTGSLLVLADRLRNGAELLRAASTSVRPVLNGDAAIVDRARSAAGRFGGFGYAVDGIVATGLVPAGSDPWLVATAAQQQRWLEKIQDDLPKVPVHRWIWGEDALSLYRDADPMPPGPAADVPVVTRDQQDYLWSVPMPFTSAAQLSLVRSGDELIVTRAQDRRILSLPSVLRRCTVVGSRLRAGELRIRFRPDPAVWRKSADDD